jgi:DNA transposition AAA+ family ATPase
MHPHHTPAVLARSHYIGISKKALDAYLAGVYFLPREEGGLGGDPHNSRLEHAVAEFRARIEAVEGKSFVESFVETRTWKQLEKACLTAVLENVIVVAYGQPGIGKSRCLAEFALRHMVVAPITILCSINITPVYFVEKLAKAVGCPHHPRIGKTEDSIAEKLRRTPRPVFVDQANYLNENCLGSLCYIWDLSKAPIVLIGTKSLYDLFFSSKITHDVRSQITSRVAMHYLLSELTISETKALIQKMLDQGTTDEVIMRIYNATKGNFRHLEMFYPRFKELIRLNEDKLKTGEAKLDDIITAAALRLMVG